MKALIQRVAHASVVVDGETVGAVERGIMALIGFGAEDKDTPPIEKMRDKILTLRIFPDEKGRFDQSVQDISGGVLLVPQFTLYGECSKGRRPDFFSALQPDIATSYFDQLIASFREKHSTVEAGVFGADMKVSLLNDGPVTLMLEM